jgi:hypothetical protein
LSKTCMKQKPFFGSGALRTHGLWEGSCPPGAPGCAWTMRGFGAHAQKIDSCALRIHLHPAARKESRQSIALRPAPANYPRMQTLRRYPGENRDWSGRRRRTPSSTRGRPPAPAHLHRDSHDQGNFRAFSRLSPGEPTSPNALRHTRARDVPRTNLECTFDHKTKLVFAQKHV